MRQHPVAGDKVFIYYSGKRIAIVDPGTGVVHDANRVQPRCSYWSLGKQRIGRRDRVKGLSFNPDDVPYAQQKQQLGHGTWPPRL